MDFQMKPHVSNQEEFKPETITGNGFGEQLLTLHRKNCRLYYLSQPPGIEEMVYVENLFETHWNLSGRAPLLRNLRIFRNRCGFSPEVCSGFLRSGKLYCGQDRKGSAGRSL